ncbi:MULTISPECIES: AlbA family DNA-binding domain-containing protein [Leptolyngbya]|jgi:hypothetical protein|uniref:AlbA family DNA-binding domain-containing protein n=1 Tax=Leptolyngbya TaxID=47251 RepID=UPI00037B012B|nr:MULTISPECIES: ATP-binding protein [Leptolyngbya]MBD2371093.1 ATP-binding protein [Leptolyngbya sp. FACHB-161]MBD2377561.1 ATP-binding protein [Leptolyngbya sp. FACHB-238]MBD2402014.1 ATP-binding protein [Leptolyngbya sp. FACHB-239]MBD2408533.1 ATP-binding protein [Leptolyngbya sp. FACHB-402]BAS60433.1 hypothetical protein LBWT_Y0210 [Leptolyngbya boryana IAM M-101]
MLKIDLESFDLTQLPTAEDDHFEFKCSGVSMDDLKKKLKCAVSGFANSGGGCFVAGVDGDGNADGGVPLKVGKQALRDWVDQAVYQVEPTPSYEIKLIQDSAGRGEIKAGFAVLLVVIAESNAGPHMAPDKCYYIRAGAHTERAQHFIVEAIWAKRHLSKPRLTHSLRLKPDKELVAQLGVLALTDAPALNVSISISPLPRLLQNYSAQFPIKCSMIDRSNPYFFDIATYAGSSSEFDRDIVLNAEYDDLAGNHYVYSAAIQATSSLPPISIGGDPTNEIVKVLKSIDSTIAHLKTSREKVVKASPLLPKRDESVFSSVEALIPELLADMKNDLSQYPFVREFVLLSDGWIYDANPNNIIFSYYFEQHPYLRGKLRILENHALVYEITYNDVLRFVMTEELAAYLLEDFNGESQPKISSDRECN